MGEFLSGQKLNTISGGVIEIIKKIGAGGQGTVYKVQYNGKNMALKWYHAGVIPNKAAFYENMRENIKMGAPNSTFLWPLELTEQYDDSFGYLMELRPPEYVELWEFLRAKVRFSGVQAAIHACLLIIEAFKELHASGCSYQDLNDGNFFIRPDTGDVLICDNDNVAPNGENLGILGKCRYMAPEIVMRKNLPNTYSDRYSMAVILYMILFLNHPLEGKRTLCPCMTEKLERTYYGENPCFVWDAAISSNRPVEGVHINEIRLWPVFPAFIRTEFQKAFSQEQLIGDDIQNRTTDRQWLENFMALKDCVVHCSACGEETFLNVNGNNQCMNCGRPVEDYFILRFPYSNVVLKPGVNIYKYHTVLGSDDIGTEIGTVIRNKKRPDIWGIQNCSEYQWTETTPDGRKKEIRNGEVAVLGKGWKIDFGAGVTAEIC